MFAEGEGSRLWRARGRAGMQAVWRYLLTNTAISIQVRLPDNGGCIFLGDGDALALGLRGGITRAGWGGAGGQDLVVRLAAARLSHCWPGARARAQSHRMMSMFVSLVPEFPVPQCVCLQVCNIARTAPCPKDAALPSTKSAPVPTASTKLRAVMVPTWSLSIAANVALRPATSSAGREDATT